MLLFLVGSFIKSISYIDYLIFDWIKSIMLIFMKDLFFKFLIFIEGLLNIVIYFFFVLIGVLIILCGLCVCIYFYKYCIK